MQYWARLLLRNEDRLPRRLIQNLLSNSHARGEHIERVKTDHGFWMDLDTRDYVARMIWAFGIWEPNIVHWVRDTLRAGDSFIDVGANLGYYSLLASQLVGEQGRVFAFEASPTIYASMCRNLALNDCANTEAVNVAVTNRDGPTSVYLGPPDDRGESNILGEFNFGFEVEIAGRRLETLLNGTNLDRLSIVKIDTEGAEALVVNGLGSLWQRLPETAQFVVEIWPEVLARNGFSAEQLIGEFTSRGYHAFVIDNDYSVRSYRHKHRYSPPRPLHDRLETWADVIFTRQHDRKR